LGATSSRPETERDTKGTLEENAEPACRVQF